MKSLLLQLSFWCLLISCLRLSASIKQARELHEERNSEISLIPGIGSLYGIDLRGHATTAALETKSRPEKQEYLLIFTIHKATLSADVQYWNDVVQIVHASEPSNVFNQYWGVCDEGSQCRGAQLTAQFAIIGYLDPYEMEIVAKADGRHEVLLYNHSMMLKERIGSAVSSEVVSKRILEKEHDSDASEQKTD